jgi:hypothetical protein
MKSSKLKVSAGSAKWLKAIHIYLGCIWGGGRTSIAGLVYRHYLSLQTMGENRLYAIVRK